MRWRTCRLKTEQNGWCYFILVTNVRSVRSVESFNKPYLGVFYSLCHLPVTNHQQFGACPPDVSSTFQLDFSELGQWANFTVSGWLV